jgi:hypothetical protein
MNNCNYCGEELLKNNSNQIVKWHKKCRTKGRQAERKAKNNLCQKKNLLTS